MFKDEYELSVNRFKLFIRIKKNGHLILSSIEEGPTPLPTMTVDGKVVTKSISGYTPEEKAQYFTDIEAQNCLVQSLTNDVYRRLDSYQDSSSRYGINWRRSCYALELEISYG